MRAVGLITEYNPFHNGHLHHLRESLKQADAEVSVAVMSGHFLQRGEPALFDKWRRTELALAAGVDLVLELPFPWACNSAPCFAKGAVQALNALNGVDALCFGSESGELKPLQDCAQVLQIHSQQIETRTGQLLRKGISYPAARSAVVAGLTEKPEASDLLARPNNILGIEYLRALDESGSSIRPLTIQRIGAGYHDREAVEGIASATGIRQMLRQGEAVDALLPQGSAALLQDWLQSGVVADDDYLLRLVLARINLGADSLKSIYQIDDGLENRLLEMGDKASSYQDLISEVKSRQLTRTRIQRALCYLLNDVQAEQMDSFLESGPLYLHLLGSSRKGERFVARHRKQFAVPVISNYSRIHSRLKRCYSVGSRAHTLAEQMLELELRATRNYTLLLKCQAWSNRNRDFFEPLRRVQ